MWAHVMGDEQLSWLGIYCVYNRKGSLERNGQQASRQKRNGQKRQTGTMRSPIANPNNPTEERASGLRERSPFISHLCDA